MKRPFLISTLCGLAISATGWFAPPGQITSKALLLAPGLESPSRAKELSDRIAIASLGLLSREKLEALIRAYGLYKGDAPIDASIDRMRRDIRIEPAMLGPGQVVAVSFRDQGPRFTLDGIDGSGRFQAQRVNLWLAKELIDADRSTHTKDEAFQLLEPSSLAHDRTAEARGLALILGLPVGMITGTILAWRKRRFKVPIEIPAAT